MNSTVQIIAISASALFSATALFFAYLSWHKNRVIYSLERMKFAKDTGDSRNEEEKETDQKLLNKLKSGKYNIVTSYDSGKNYNVLILGKVKK